MSEESNKSIEVESCGCVACELNRLEGTDYRAKPITQQSTVVDVELVSESGRYPARHCQVVSIPSKDDLIMREDNQNIQRLKEKLHSALEQGGLTHYVIGLILTEKAFRSKVKAGLIEELAHLILDRGRDRNVRLGGAEIEGVSPNLAPYISHVIVSHSPEFHRPEILITIVAWPEGDWIAKGIKQKLEKYGNDPDAVKELMLVIRASGFVDREAINSFRNLNPPEILPFSEIWIVTRFDGTLRLKP